MFQRIQYIDDVFLNWIGRLHKPVLNKIMTVISALGSKGIIWFIICIPFLIIPSLRLTGLNIIVGLGITNVSGEAVIKHIVCRVRPCHKLEDDELIVKRPRYYSFPSGHTASSFSVVAVVAFRLWPVAIPIALLASIMGFSRLYLRVHYLTDVLCGMILGLLCGFLSVELFNQLVF